MASSALAIRAGVSSIGGSFWRFAATFAGFRKDDLGAGREAVFAGFLGMLQVPDAAAISGLRGRRKRAEMKHRFTLQLGPRPLYSARNSLGPARPRGGSPATPV